MSKLISIIVDDRERRSGVLDALIHSGAFDVRMTRLDIGDYRVDGRFLFERKTLPDFVASVISGRLFEQALRLTNQDNIHPVLILEGTASDLRNTRMSWEALQGALVTVSVFIGVPVLRTRNAEETVNSFLYVVRQARVIAQGGLPRRGYRPKGKAAYQNYLLQGLPGVGPARAQHLLEHFGSVRAVMTADESELTKIDGVGRTIARRIAWAVEEAPGSYRLGSRLDGCEKPA